MGMQVYVAGGTYRAWSSWQDGCCVLKGTISNGNVGTQLEELEERTDLGAVGRMAVVC